MSEKIGKKVVVIKSHPIDRQTRATKVIRTLSGNDYFVKHICWDRGIVTPRSEKKEAGGIYTEIRLKLKAPWGNQAFIFLPIWWSFIFFQLMITKWDIAHAGEFTTILPALVAGKLKKKPVIYENMDTFADIYILPDAIRTILINIDKIFMKYASAVILADEAQIEEYSGISNPNVVAIYDSPDTISKVNLNPHKNDVFTLFFVGLLYSGKKLNLDKVFTAVQDIEGVKVVIAGYGDLTKAIKKLSQTLPNKIEFIGEISHAEALERSAKADLLFVLRDPIVLANKYICGSKILEAMMCSTPILVNKGTSTANKVREENCGLVVDANNIVEIRNAIIKLRDDPELCKALGANGRKAYEGRYSWDIMEHRLLDCYKKLTCEEK